MKSPILSCAMVVTFSLGALNAVNADSATWSMNPISSDWNTAANELFGNGTLEMGSHDAPAVSVGSIEGDGLVFLELTTCTFKAKRTGPKPTR